MTYRPLPVRLSSAVWEAASRAHRRQALLVVLAIAASVGVAALLSGPAGAEPPQIAAKRAEAQRVLNDIHALDVEMEKAIEAYNGATDQLAAIERARALNTHHLAIAKRNLTIAQGRLGLRLRAIYTAGQNDSTLAILLGSHSIGDFLNRMRR